tara:strand:+ start:95 stop:520 length:426 start_codon:yes stop_codon:yes gene_type:complete
MKLLFKKFIVCFAILLSGCTLRGHFDGKEVYCGTYQEVQQDAVSRNLLHLFKNKQFSIENLEPYISLPSDTKEINDNAFYYYSAEQCNVTIQTKDNLITNISAAQEEVNDCAPLGRRLGRDIGQYTWTIQKFMDSGCLISK